MPNSPNLNFPFDPKTSIDYLSATYIQTGIPKKSFILGTAIESRSNPPIALQPPKSPTSKRRVPPSNIQFPEIPFEARPRSASEAATSISHRGSVSNRAHRPAMCEGVESSVSRAGNGRSEVTAPPTLARRMEGRRSGGRGRDRRGCRRPGNLCCLVGHAARGRGWRGILPRATYIHILSVRVYIHTYTGWFRNSCHEGVKDKGKHVVCNCDRLWELVVAYRDRCVK